MARITEGQVDPLDPVYGDLPLIAPNHMEAGTGRLLDLVSVSDQAAISGKYLCERGDVLYSKIRPHLRKATLAPVRCLTSADVYPIRPGPDLDARYLLYLLLSDTFTTLAVMESERVAMPKINRDSLMSLRLPQPPLIAQRAIADYLDAETARIDALIAKKRSILELADERRMSIMRDGVSGRYTSSTFSPARLPWLDHKASDWLELRLTLTAQLGSGHTPSRTRADWWLDCTVPWITTGEVAQVRSDRVEFIYETRERISELGLQNSAAQLHPAGTVVLCRTASAGYSAIMGTDMATSQDFATWTCGPFLRPRFLLLCLRVMRQDLLGRLAMGSTHKTIYMPDIEALRIPLPPVTEQDDIVEQTWRRLRETDAVVSAVGRQIDLLSERRQTLVTAAVSGELDIPGVAA